MDDLVIVRSLVINSANSDVPIRGGGGGVLDTQVLCVF